MKKFKIDVEKMEKISGFKSRSTMLLETTAKKEKVQSSDITTFDDLKRDFETLYLKASCGIISKNSTEYVESLEKLSTACVNSVLKKIYTASCNPIIKNLQYGVMISNSQLKALKNAVNNSSTLEYNKSGKLVSVVTDKKLHSASNILITKSLDDGINLTQTAKLLLEDESKKMLEYLEKYYTTCDVVLKCKFLDNEFVKRQLKKKVYIQDINSLGGYESIFTTPIQEVYKGIRREIESQQAIKNASTKFIYLDELYEDIESDESSIVYRRLPKYSGLGTET